VPRNHYRTHPSFPQLPASHLEQPSMFEKFDVDLLFFIFYFQQVGAPPSACVLCWHCTPAEGSQSFSPYWVC
jgi:hypothetical protein